jgi:2-octaprenyl-6-methoxyphenol hydroxylase
MKPDIAAKSLTTRSRAGLGVAVADRIGNQMGSTVGSTVGSTIQARDIIICGGSFAGMLAAVALVHELGPDLRIMLIDRAAAAGEAATGDARATAVSAASVNMLTALGLWAQLAPVAQPVLVIELTDTSLAAAVRPVVMTYDNLTADGLPATWIVPNSVLGRVLAAAVAAAPSIQRAYAAEVVRSEVTDAVNTLTLADGRQWAAPLVIAADGRGSRLRGAAGIKMVGWDHAQTGIVTTVAHSQPHHGRAIQHFLPGGPFAVLPLAGGLTSCVTWSEDADTARSLLHLDDAAFLAALDTRMAGARGQLTLAGPRQSWPLESRLAQAFVAPRLALIGDAAHSVHPIAGQGLNLAMRDIAALAECVADAASTGCDIGTTLVLVRYERWRRFDSGLSMAAFDGLNWLFSNDYALLRATRGLGLALVNQMAPIKQALVTEAAGLSGTLPKLLAPPCLASWAPRVAR